MVQKIPCVQQTAPQSLTLPMSSSDNCCHFWIRKYTIPAEPGAVSATENRVLWLCVPATILLSRPRATLILVVLT